MNIKQGGFWMSFIKQRALMHVLALIIVLFGQLSSVQAEEDMILTSANLNALSGDNMQLSFEMTGDVKMPKVFHTDSPARIVLDFIGAKSALEQKKNTINAGGVSSFVAIEAAGRLRIVINLLKLVPYEVKLEGSRAIVILRSSGKVARESHKKLSEKTLTQFAALIPKQAINKIDFRRGKKGEGRLLIALSNPNTVVNAQEKAGKIELTFLNTSLPNLYAKKMDVLDFATPVSMVEAKKVGSKVKILITPVDENYAYTSFQSDGLLSVDIRPISTEEEAQRREKFPYSGDRLSLSFHDIEVRSVLQILADFTDLNIIVNDSVTGNLTLRLNDVPWDQALDFILKAQGLAKRQAGNVILVAPTAEISKLEQEELDAIKVVERLEPLKTEYIQINYAKAENFRNILLGNSSISADGCAVSSNKSGSSRQGNQTNSGSSRGNQVNSGSGSDGGVENNYTLLSARGTALVDSRTNTLIVKDTSKQLEEIRKMISILDRRVYQVLIEARIVIAESGFAQELGVKFGAAYTGGDGVSTSFKAGGTTGGSTNPGDGDIISPILSNLAVSNPYGALGMTLADGANYVLNLEITALQDDRKAEFVSNPKVLTSNRCKASIKQGVEIPYQTVSQNGTRTQFKDAKILLEVTPQITPNGSIIMLLKITKDSPGDITPGGLAINSREINTSVQIEDGQTVVLGGVYEGDTVNVVNSVPWFKDLPLVGWMFRKTVKNNSKKELLIFITPKVVKDSMRMR
jgi:type IV pilus assembly protein PilQ